MQIEHFSFGEISIDGVTYDHDVVIDRGQVRKRKKKPSKKYKAEFGHTPLSIKEEIPWDCQHLVIGTGAYGKLPVMKKVEKEAKRRNVEIEAIPTEEAIKILNQNRENSNAILHVTC